MKTFKRKQLLIFVICTTWLLILHRPALLSFGRAIPGRVQSDAIRGQWSAWVAAHDFWPLHTAMVNFPDGAALLPLPPISLSIVAPFTLFFGANVGIVALVMMHAALAIAGGYFLARSIALEKWPSVCCGLLLSAAPMMGEALSVGVYECLTIGWSALCLGSLIRACKGDGLGWALASGCLYFSSRIYHGP